MIYDKHHNGGSFNMGKSEITIGINCIDKDPNWTLSIISHEIMEIILLTMGARFSNGRLENDYLFNFNHQTFENAIQLHSSILVKFICTD